jgi:armadillo repeat-containing protein 8
MAIDRGSGELLINLAKSLTPTDSDEDEPERLSHLREVLLVFISFTNMSEIIKAVFTVVAALSLFDNATRRKFTELIPIINASLTHRHVGIRYASCQCVRALSRDVAILRTNMMDSGLGMSIFHVFKKQEEDRQVTFAALSAICNLVNEFSPLRSVSRLVKLLYV